MLLSLLKFTIGWPISIIALFFIVKIIIDNGKSVLPNLNNINVGLLFLGILFFVLYYFLRAYVWKAILKLQGYDLPFKHVVYLWELSEFKRFAPGKVWSFIGRVSLFGDLNIPQKILFKSILIEIQFLLLANAIVSLLAFPFIATHIIRFPSQNLAFTISLLSILLITIILIFSSWIFKNVFQKCYSEPFNNALGKLRRGISHNLMPVKKDSSTRPAKPDLVGMSIKASPKAKISILSTSCLSAIFFGLGTYFSIVSIVYLPLELFTQILGFFVFSYLISYLSFITPMGMGIREGVVMIGLSNMIPLPLAGMAAVSARIVSIIGELYFLGITYLWKNTKNKYVNFLENFVLTHKQQTVLLLIVLAYIIYFTFASFLRYDNFYTGRYDLGNMDQVVWNTTQGKVFQTNNQNGEIISRLAVHADFILILLAPFYMVWEHPKMLLLIQTVALGLGAIFVYALGKNIIKNKNLSLVFSFLFLLNPAVQYTNLYDFHAVTLATTFLLGAFYFLLRKHYLWFSLLAILAALTKEQIWVVIALFGIYMVFSKPTRHSGDQAIRLNLTETPESLRNLQDKGDSGQARLAGASAKRARMTKRRLFGLTIIMVSVLVFYLLIWHAIPSERGGEHFALSYYSEFGGSPTNIVKDVFLSPQKAIATFFQKEQLDYLRQLFQPLGFISFFSPLYLMFALPDILINTLSENPKLHQIYYQYSAAITPFIFISGIFGVRNLKTRFPKIPYAFFIFYFLFFIFYSSYSYGPLPFARKPNIDMITKPQENKVEIENVISSIPTYYSIAATNNVGSHLSQRQIIFTTPYGIDKADIIVFLIKDDWRETNKEYLKTQMESLKKVQNDKNYKKVFKINETFIVFERQWEP